MSSLLAGLLTVALSSNPPAAISNIITGKDIPVAMAVSNDPVEAAYHRLLLDDDNAQQDIIKWSDDASASGKTGPGSLQFTLSARIRQRLDQIKGEYEAFLAEHPNHAKARLAYGSFLNDIKDDEGAAAQWEKARELDPKNPAAWNNLANYYGHRSPVKKAFEYYAKAIELDSNEPVYYQNLATTVYMFRTDAEEYYHLDEHAVFDKALDLYRKAIKLDPDNFVLYSDYAMSFYGTKPPRWQDGLTAWTEALKIAHDDLAREGVYIHLARINIKLDHFEEARRWLGQVTNTTYAPLKKTLTRNLNEALKKATSGPIEVAPAD